MQNRLDVDYEVKADYTQLDPPKFVPILSLYNLILIPANDQSNQDLLNISVSDDIKIFNKTTNKYSDQKVILQSGFVVLQDVKYYYFYIGRGIPITKSDFVLRYQSKNYDLTTNFDNPQSIKLLMGSLILKDNFKYMFDINNNSLIRMLDKNFICKIIKIDNKHNYFKANTTNTILHILDHSNLTVLQNINNPYIENLLIRPLSNPNSPLGRLMINIKDPSGVSNNNELRYKIFINNASYFTNNVLDIKNLVGGSYSIKIIDRTGPIQIRNLNGQLINSDSFQINIPSIKDEYKTLEHKLSNLHPRLLPNKGHANIMINLQYDKSFEIFGPNNFYRKYSSGHQALYNMHHGQYTIKSENITKDFLIIKNNNNHISSLL